MISTQNDEEPDFLSNFMHLPHEWAQIAIILIILIGIYLKGFFARTPPKGAVIEDARVNPERIILRRMKKVELKNCLDYASSSATMRLVTAYVALPLFWIMVFQITNTKEHMSYWIAALSKDFIEPYAQISRWGNEWILKKFGRLSSF